MSRLAPIKKVVKGLLRGRPEVLPFVKRKVEISIGIYTGASPLEVAQDAVRNPVLSARDVTDAPADFVADPFMIRHEDHWFMFFEMFNRRSRKGVISLATSRNGFQWTYERVVLREPFHLSYPFVFEQDGAHFMIPESRAANTVRLYRAQSFPYAWKFVGDLIEGGRPADATPFCHDGLWWMFAETSGGRHDTLCLYWSKTLAGPWREHPTNPIVTGDPSIARPAGRVLAVDGKLYRFAQNCRKNYGDSVGAFEITELTPERYAEREVDTNPILRGQGRGWNSRGMHHIDTHRVDDGRWIACVDGFNETLVLDLKKG